VSKTSPVISKLLESCQQRDLPAHYLAFFECFNRGLFFEAHEVLEELWLPSRPGPNGSFYQGLIQIAGAFVHLQKNRPQPAAALFKLARARLLPYAPAHMRLDVDGVLHRVEQWLGELEPGGAQPRSLKTLAHPRLDLSVPP